LENPQQARGRKEAMTPAAPSIRYCKERKGGGAGSHKRPWQERLLAFENDYRGERKKRDGFRVPWGGKKLSSTII